ncbi:MAG: glycerol-3-phosphate acyltransferase [Bacteroidota bacterium]
MEFIRILLCTLGAYLIGAIPSSIILGKVFFGIDIRDHGSGSASHRNVSRIMGPNMSLIVRILDISKGFLAANLAFIVHNKYGIFSDIELPIIMMSLGLAAVLGHIFPIFASFRGGKGIHVTLGMLIATQPLVGSIFILITLCAYLISRYPNLAYMVGALAIPVYYLATRHHHAEMFVPLLVFGGILFGLLFMTHRENLLDIVHGDAERVDLLIDFRSNRS